MGGRLIFYIFFPTALMTRTVLKETFDALHLNCQNEKVIKIKCLDKNRVFFSNMLANKIAAKLFSFFQTFFL